MTAVSEAPSQSFAAIAVEVKSVKFVDRFRNADSLGVEAVIAIMFGVAFLVMTPLYIQLNYVTTWLDTPMELFLVAVIAGMAPPRSHASRGVIVTPHVPE